LDTVNENGSDTLGTRIEEGLLMKPTQTRRIRRRPSTQREAGSPQQDSQKEQKFFGPGAHEPFFPPATVVARAADPAAGEKKEEKVARAPDEKKEDAIRRTPLGEHAEQKEEEEKLRKAHHDGKKEKVKVHRAPQEKQEEKLAKAPAADKDEKVARAPEDKEEKISAKGEGAGVGKSTARYVASMASKGQPLAKSEQAFYGARMGYDFGQVRIHTGKDAAESARDAGARAYTYGNHVAFDEGQYNTDSHEGRKLLAHELTHVVQQGSGRLK